MCVKFIDVHTLTVMCRGINMSCSIMNTFVCNSLLLLTVIQERNEKYPIRKMTNYNHSSLSTLPQSDHERRNQIQLIRC